MESLTAEDPNQEEADLAKAADRAKRDANQSHSFARFRVLVAAGEASSDLHAAAVIREIRALVPNAEVFGMGGSALRAVGVDTIVDSEHSASVMGITEVIGSLGKLFRAFRVLKDAGRDRKPDVAILIDFPDFNLRLAKVLKKQGVPVLYYISPQLWAWRSGRVRTVRNAVRKVAAIFPFEESFYHRHGVDAEYVGHPMAYATTTPITREELDQRLGLERGQTVVALLPGSRRSEIERLLPPMLDALEQIEKYRSDLAFVSPIAPGVSEDYLREIAGERFSKIRFYPGRASDLLAHATVTVVASGTATVETALAGSPMIVVYKLSPLTYRIARLLVRGVQYFAMPNLIAGEKVACELLQDEVTGDRIRIEVEQLLGDPLKLQNQRDKLQIVRKRLHTDHSLSPAARAAEMALEIVQERLQPSQKRGVETSLDKMKRV